MEGQRDYIEHILSVFFIVILQIVEESLLVSKIEVILKVVVDQGFSLVVAVMLSLEKTISFKTCEIFNN